MKIERKYFPLSVSGSDVKRSGATMEFSGYGSTFGGVDSYGDTIEKGAFAESVLKANSKNDWPQMLLMHGGAIGGALDMLPLGIWTSMREDNTGLYLNGVIANTAIGRDVWQLLTMTPRPAISGLSIGFGVEATSTRHLPMGAVRRITKARLLEISLVTFPANTDARVTTVGHGLSSPLLSEAASASDEAYAKFQETLSRLAPPTVATMSEIEAEFARVLEVMRHS